MTDLKPTPEQAEIIACVQTEPNTSLMVDVRAGAAKTSTIKMACQALSPEVHSCLAVAFNKKIAEELQAQVPSSIDCKTLNALGHRAWMSALNKRLELDSDKMFKLVKEVVPHDETKQDEYLFTDVLNLARKAKSVGLVPRGAPMNRVGLCPDEDYVWKDLCFELSIDMRAALIDYARDVILLSIKAAYQGRIDFDDQIYMSVLFGGVYPKYHTVIVDEAQDLSPLNHEQLKKATGTRLIAVGDPFQAIYAFRGADSNSMETLLESFEPMKRLGLTFSFRCPHNVAARQTDWVKDFKSWPTNTQGEVERWPRTLVADPSRPTSVNETLSSWSLTDLPATGAILCRNNAPLLKLAFAIIKTRRPVKILGRDIGASLASLLNRICSKNDIPVDDAIPLLHAWREQELLKVADSESKQATIHDRHESLLVLLEASGAKTTKAAEQFIRELFADKADGLVLSSIHRAKGLEWNWVMHLDPWRVPSKMAVRAAERGNAGPIVQEKNLVYVAETRTKDILVEADLDDCEELGG